MVSYWLLKWDILFELFIPPLYSVNGTFLSDCDDGTKISQRKRESLRKYHQLVQCISLVFASVSEKVICLELPFPSSECGPLLPLVVVRVLSSISE